ncbi:ABC transporter permease [Paenibacillus eucommiae]|uniref:Aldouronate transport system permease protein n=1 Tax=Paenibacillus eucommiae TaxID=1355755 RepID=A0ABS4J902_9BACL|nr:ABC transporter permease subunit [Paenibacillus eucommiae]MBP1995740.1 putative aldouronate transport system permease protein [Paenibacillus eucommiae]
MTLAKNLRKYRAVYLMFLPVGLYVLIFNYVPYYGLVIAFQKFSPFLGINKSPWVGMANFEFLFQSGDFFRLLKNTLLISLYRLVFGFPAPLIFALLLNEVKNMLFKRLAQTITYLPHFLSWIIFGALMISFLSPEGVINKLLAGWGYHPVEFLIGPEYFRTILVVTGTLKEFGWGAIIYLAALSGVDPTLYEAARVDGASRWRQLWHVTLPALVPVTILLFIMQLAYILDAGFEQVYVFMNPTQYAVGDIIDTYVYRIGLTGSNFSVAAAMGLFKGVVGLFLIVSTNKLVKRMGHQPLW